MCTCVLKRTVLLDMCRAGMVRYMRAMRPIQAHGLPIVPIVLTCWVNCGGCGRRGGSRSPYRYPNSCAVSTAVSYCMPDERLGQRRWGPCSQLPLPARHLMPRHEHALGAASPGGCVGAPMSSAWAATTTLYGTCMHGTVVLKPRGWVGCAWADWGKQRAAVEWPGARGQQGPGVDHLCGTSTAFACMPAPCCPPLASPALQWGKAGQMASR